MNKSKHIKTGDKNKGVSVTYIKSRKVLSLTAWYDGGYGGMNSEEMPLAEFMERLGITKKDVL